MDRIIVEGGNSLHGEVKISGSKNAALPILMSSLLADGWSTYTNVPALKDIESTLQLLENIGAKVETDGNAIKKCYLLEVACRAFIPLPGVPGLWKSSLMS